MRTFVLNREEEQHVVIQETTSDDIKHKKVKKKSKIALAMEELQKMKDEKNNNDDSISLHRDMCKQSVAEFKSKKLNGEVFGASLGEILAFKKKERECSDRFTNK